MTPTEKPDGLARNNSSTRKLWVLEEIARENGTSRVLVDGVRLFPPKPRKGEG